MTLPDSPFVSIRAGPPVRRALARRVLGRVESVRASGVLARLEDGSVFALLPAGTPLHPWAVSASTLHDQGKVAAGDRVRGDGRILRVGGLALELPRADVPSLRLHRRLIPGGLPRAAERLAGFPEGGVEPVLASEVQRLRTGEVKLAVTGLVGLGSGLTPSGDDIIVGLLSALELAADAAPEAQPMRAAVAVVLEENVDSGTTKLSAQLVRAAVAGLYAEPILGLLAALAAASVARETKCDARREAREQADGPQAALEASRAALLRMGHESGRSVLAGITLALNGLGCSWAP